MSLYLFVGNGAFLVEINAREKKVRELLKQYNIKHIKHGISRTSKRSWIRFLRSKGLKVRNFRPIEIYF